MQIAVAGVTLLLPVSRLEENDKLFIDVTRNVQLHCRLSITRTSIPSNEQKNFFATLLSINLASLSECLLSLSFSRRAP